MQLKAAQEKQQLVVHLQPQWFYYVPLLLACLSSIIINFNCTFKTSKSFLLILITNRSFILQQAEKSHHPNVLEQINLPIEKTDDGAVKSLAHSWFALAVMSTQSKKYSKADSLSF